MFPQMYGKWISITPAHLWVGVLEGGGEDTADVGHVNKHQGYSDQGVQYRDHLD